MNEEKKRWVPVFFPNGPFKGNVNLSINGANVCSAETAKELIDAVEKNDADKNNSAGNTGSEGTPEVPESGQVCTDVHTCKDA